jgi:thymidylate kinase
MRKFVVFAGPQAAGKSSVINELGSQPYSLAALFPTGKAPPFVPLQESRQIIVHKYLLLGAISLTQGHEEEIIRCDLDRMDIILERSSPPVVYLDECNVFTIAHGLAHDVREVKAYWDHYLRRLTQLDASVIFLDLPPKVSWDRRKRRYEQRLLHFPLVEHAKVMGQYHDYLFRLHPLLHAVYRRLPLQKVMIDGHTSPENLLKLVCRELARFLQE